MRKASPFLLHLTIPAQHEFANLYARQWLELDLSPHPEGGFYRRIFQSPWILSNEKAISHDTTKQHPSSSLSMHFPRPIATSIYFLLTSSEPLSHLHRLAADEQWLFLEGDPLTICQVDPVTCEYSERIIGPVGSRITTKNSDNIDHLFLRPCSTVPSKFIKQQHSDSNSDHYVSPSHLVPGGQWFGARWTSGSYGYTLVSCLVAPGFSFEDFRLLGSSEFDALGIESRIREKMRDAANKSALETKIMQVRALVLDEARRGEEMKLEANRPTAQLKSRL